MTKLDTASSPSLDEAAQEARNWLLAAAAPLWSTVGRTGSGLFAERMSLAGEPDRAYFRTFVQARHVFSFVTIGELGWRGDWRALVTETMEVLLSRAKRADGLFVHRVDADGAPLDTRADLYDQAFILLALGTAGRAVGRQDWFDHAEALLDRIEAEWAHPFGGFREGEIADPRLRRQNPHMHLLEAFLALSEASGRRRFMFAAQTIAELSQTKFVDPTSGALLEYFTQDLDPAPGVEGTIVEPGHCFEWAWLFERLAAAGWTPGTRLSDRLTTFARNSGVDPARGVAINEVSTDGSWRDGTARLWPQTERLKAGLARFRRLRTQVESREAIAAESGLRKYLGVPKPGLWRDKLKADETWVDELAPGSSLYHISCAYAELLLVTEERNR
jgi:mannose/cellobiose epimerase-like protein (N-acyl-D-glucosamine 2-epimerase family)